MNPISNIWNHPKTSFAGLLIAVVTVAGVFAQQGVTLGTAGTGTVVSLLSAVATVLLGLLARDPAEIASQQVSKLASQQISKLAGQRVSKPGGGAGRPGVWVLIALLLPLPCIEGCSGTTVAQDIVNWTPSLQTAVATVDSTAALLAPADAPVFSVATAGFDAASNLLVTQAKAYLANPGVGTLAQLQTQVVTFEQQVNAALLAAGKIVNPTSQQHALAVLQAVATIVTAILALVQSISSKAAVARMAAESSIKLAAVRPMWNRGQAAAMLAAHYREPAGMAEIQLARAERVAVAAGF
ncbi:MAG TPA: hypothetical protein VL991_09575 [Terracidiphilus sp.]|nr:hypothetical protein [Terracidiphilus sp.]